MKRASPTRPTPRSTSTARATSSMARARPAPAASSTAAPAASTAISSVRRRTKTRRFGPATSIRKRSSKPRSSRAPKERVVDGRRIEVTIARPIGIYGPERHALPEDVSRDQEGHLPDARRGRGVLSPHLHRRSRRGVHPVRGSAAGRGPHLHPRRAAVYDDERAGAADGRCAGREAALAAAAGVAVLDRGVAVRADLRAAAASSRRSIAAASTSTRRAAPSTSRGPGPNWATRPPSISKPDCAAPSSGIVSRHGCRQAPQRRPDLRSPRMDRFTHARREAAVRVDDPALRSGALRRVAGQPAHEGHVRGHARTARHRRDLSASRQVRSGDAAARS